MRVPAFAALAAAALTVATLGAGPAEAQFSQRYEFFKAVREGKAAEVKAIVDQPGSAMINARDLDSGQTALHIVTDRRDAPWINFLQQAGADVNVRDQNGETPLMLATAKRFSDGVRLLLAYGADANIANNRGETPLIRAVQRRDADIVRLLLGAGANPDAGDHIAGLSARDYATRDRRAAQILALIEGAEAQDRATFGPSR